MIAAALLVLTAGLVACGQPASETMEYIGYLDYEGIVNYFKTELGGTIPEDYAKPQGRITVVGNE